eukprot:Skav231144  [mRNA]  locus=scaffold2333:148666:176262:+ [translate_table: standard]
MANKQLLLVSELGHDIPISRHGPCFSEFLTAWWSFGFKEAPKAAAFDKDALKKLAEQAQRFEEQQAQAPAPLPQVPQVPQVPSLAPPVPAMVPPPMATQPLPGLGPGAPVAPPPPPPGQPVPPGAPAYDLEALKRLAAGNAPVPDVKAAPPKSMGFSGFTLQTSAPAQRDNDSVQKMLARLQGNVQGAKQALSATGSAPVPLPFVQQTSHKLGGNSGLADVDWEPLQEHIKAATSRSEIEEASRDFLKKFAQLSVEQIAEIIRLMEAKAASYPKDFYTELGSMLGHKLKSATSPQLALTMSSFLYWSPQGRQRFIDCSRDFLAVAAAEVPTRLMELAPHELNCCLAGVVSLGCSDHKFFVSVGKSAQARHKTFAPKELGSLLTILSEVRLVHVDLFTSAAQAIAPRVRELRAAEIMRCTRALSRCGVKNEAFCQAVGDDIVGRWSKSQPTSHSGFRCEDLVEACWCFAVLEFYHHDLLQLMFQVLRESPKVAADALAEHKERYAPLRIDDKSVSSLLEHYKENRRDCRRCSEKVRSDITAAVKGLLDGHARLSVQSNHRTSVGLLSDVAAMRKRSSTDGKHLACDLQCAEHEKVLEESFEQWWDHKLPWTSLFQTCELLYGRASHAYIGTIFNRRVFYKCCSHECEASPLLGSVSEVDFLLSLVAELAETQLPNMVFLFNTGDQPFSDKAFWSPIPQFHWIRRGKWKEDSLQGLVAVLDRLCTVCSLSPAMAKVVERRAGDLGTVIADASKASVNLRSHQYEHQNSSIPPSQTLPADSLVSIRQGGMAMQRRGRVGARTPSRVQAFIGIAAATLLLVAVASDAFVTATPSVTQKPGAVSIVLKPTSRAPAPQQATGMLRATAATALLCLAVTSARRGSKASHKVRVHSVMCSAARLPVEAQKAPVSQILEQAVLLEACQEIPSAIPEVPPKMCVEQTQAVMATPVASSAPAAKKHHKAARLVGQTRHCNHRSARAARSAFASSQKARRTIGKRLQANSRPVPVAQASFDPSTVRSSVQIGLRISSTLRSEKGRESKSPSSLEGSDMSTGLRIQANEFRE